MAFRFRRTLKIAPGLKINFGKRGVSLSAGVRGATMTAGRHGLYGNVGLTGSGMSYRTRLGANGEQRRAERTQQRYALQTERLEQAQRHQQALKNIQLKLKDNGVLLVEDAFNQPLSREDLKQLWQQKQAMIEQWLLQQIDTINGDVDLLAQVHEDTPAPDCEPRYSSQTFAVPEPVAPQKSTSITKPVLQTSVPLGWFKRLFRYFRQQYSHRQIKSEAAYRQALAHWQKQCTLQKAEFAQAMARYQQDKTDWQKQKAKFEQQQQIEQATFIQQLKTDTECMDDILETAITQLEWPRETTVSYQLDMPAQALWLDVDLPEIEDLPPQQARLGASGRRLVIKAKSQKTLHLEYARHIHGIVFRLVGTVLATLPATQQVVVSGYSQRLDKTTGRINDDYLFSFKVDRQGFRRIDFQALDRLDPIAALGVFEHRRKMTASGVFRVIEPFSLEEKKAESNHLQ